MGLMDFFQKGKEKPVEKKPVPPQPSMYTPPTTSAPLEYVVKHGDSLSKIAKAHYGDANEWRKIFEANKEVIKDPDLIHPGQKIIIP